MVAVVNTKLLLIYQRLLKGYDGRICASDIRDGMFENTQKVIMVVC